jgi:hypothetical protein
MSAVEPASGTLRAAPAGVSSTYKARDVEEALDVWFYRPLGYHLARAAWWLGLTPNAVTMIGALLGVLAGHLFLYEGWIPALAGIALLVLSETFDSADGQLARMSGQYSKLGRILDGLASNLVFASIYVHVAIRVAPVVGGGTAAALIVLSALSHSFQCAVSDFYRNAFLHIAGGGRAELHDSKDVERDYRALRFRDDFGGKLLLRLYLNYTRQQEAVTRSFRDLRKAIQAAYPDGTPDSVRLEYRERNKPLLKYHNILTANTRMLALGLAVLANRPLFYLGFEIVVLNGLLAAVLWAQNRNNAALAGAVRRAGGNGVA